MHSTKIDEFLEDLRFVSSERFELVRAIQKLFNEADPNLTEGIKYGGLTFSKSKALIGGIFSYKEHISIEFSDGADFPDPYGVLEGGGKRRRHIKLKNLADIDDKSVVSYVREAVKQG